MKIPRFDFSNRYRIIEDDYCGYEVQVKRWFFPFWFQVWGEASPTNTSGTLVKAKELVEKHKKGFTSRTKPNKEIWRDR